MPVLALGCVLRAAERLITHIYFADEMETYIQKDEVK